MHALYQALLRLDAEVARQVALGAKSDRLMGETPRIDGVMWRMLEGFLTADLYLPSSTGMCCCVWVMCCLK